MKIITKITLICLCILMCSVAYAQSHAPIVPSFYYGDAQVNGRDVPLDAVIYAYINGEKRGDVTVQVVGKYGDQFSQLKLGVTGISPEVGEQVSFTIALPGYEEISATQTSTWQPGEVINFDLTFSGAEIELPEPVQNETEETENTGSTSGTSGSGATGGAAGGAGAASQVVTQPQDEVSYFYAQLEGGKQKDIPINSNSIALNKIQIVLNNDISNVAVQVEDVNSPPVPNLDKVYKYVSINAPKITTNNVAIAILKFNIENSWFSSNGYDKDDVIIMRYYNNEWQELDTVFEGSDAKYHYYRAGTPGFSYFAVALKGAKETTTQKQEATANNEVNQEGSSEKEEQQTEKEEDAEENNAITGLVTGVGDGASNGSKLLTTALAIGFILFISYIIYDKLIRG